MAPQNLKARGRIRVLLVVLCAVFGIGVVINAFVAGTNAYTVLANEELGASGTIVKFAVLLACGAILDVTTFACFLVFAVSIVRNGQFFCAMHTRLFAIIGAASLLHVIIGLFMPVLNPIEVGGGLATTEAVMPTLDLRMLSFSLMFFALAGIFEYGRLLQEDSDNII